MENCKYESYYYALGILCGEFDHHTWINEKEAKDFYNKPNRTLIKGWKIGQSNGEKVAKNLEKISSICKEILKERAENGLSVEEMLNKLPDQI